MNVNVTKIERLSNGIIQFYNGNDVVDSFSITSSVSVLFENNLAKSISFVSNVKTLSFNVYNVQSVYGSTSNKIYSSGIDPSDTGSAYISRLYDIYAFIISDVIQGCCPGPTFVGGVVVTYPDYASFPVTGQESVIYIDEATNQAYFWDGSSYQPLISVSSADKMTTIGRNSTGSTLYKGTIIYISGSTGNRPNYVKAQANSEATSAGTFGVILSDIANNSDGYAVTIGTIDNLDTRSTAPNPFTSDTLVDGDTIYLSPTTAGYVTNVKPYAPDHLVYVGKVVRTSPTNGVIVYRIQNGYELDELHDVAAQTPSNNDGLFFESSTSLWKNKSISTVLGYTPFNLPSLTSGSVLFSNGTTIAQDNANLFWDDTNNRLGIGTASPSAIIHSVGSVTAATAIARGNYLQPTLVASANNDVLVGLDIQPAFTIGAFTGTSSLPMRIRNAANTGNVFSIDSIGNAVIGGSLNTNSVYGSSVINLSSGGGDLRLQTNFTANTGLTMFNATRNVVIQNGGTFTDAGYRLDVNGTARIQNQLTTTGSISAASAIARGTYLNQTLVATANNDTLIALDISPTFTTGAFTGVSQIGLRCGNLQTFASTNINLGYNSTGSTNEFVSFGNGRGYVGFDATIGGSVIGTVTTRNLSIGAGSQGSMTTMMRMFGATGNLVLQNGGTFTDAGYRLDVNGSVRTTGSISAASAIARGTYLNQTLVATANNDVLVGLDIQPTFTNGAFTGVTNYLLRAGAGIGLRNDGVVFWGNSLSGNNRGILNWDTNRAIISSGTSSTALDLAVNLTTGLKLFTSRSVMIQNGGTFTEESSSQLTVNSTTRGFLPPRQTLAQRTAIASPAVGLIVYQTDLVEGLYVYKSTGWQFIA